MSIGRMWHMPTVRHLHAYRLWLTAKRACLRRNMAICGVPAELADPIAVLVYRYGWITDYEWDRLRDAYLGKDSSK